jgi:TolA-binding protein
MSHEDPKQSDAASNGPATAPAGLPGRLLAWVLSDRLRAILVGLACVASVGMSVTAWLVMAKPPRPATRLTLRPALEALDRQDYDEAQHLAKDYQAAAADDQTGGVDFVLGAAAACLADASLSGIKAKHFLAAAQQLERARERGFPAGREAEGLFWLGKSQFYSGQLTACRPTLREALKLNPRHDAEIRYLLADAYLIDAKPNPALAEEENGLALKDRISAAWRSRLLVQRARIMLALGKPAAAVKILDSLPPAAQKASEALLVRGELLALEAQAAGANVELARQKYTQAIHVLQAAQGADTLGADVTRRSMYLTALCLLSRGDTKEATAQFQRTARMFPGTPEAANGAFQEAELLRQAGSRDALPLYGKLLRWADAGNYMNPWIALAPLQEKMLAVFQDYLQRQDFLACLELAEAFHPLFPAFRGVELRAETEMAWAHMLLSKAEGDPAQVEKLRREGRTHLRLAGRHYAALAQLLTTSRRYTDELWNGIQAYLEGHDYPHAAELLELYLKNETRRRNAQAMMLLGEALLAQGKLDEAFKSLTSCVSLHPNDAASFRARLDAAKVCVEKAQPGQAEALLRENLRAELLTPASVEWRESLFDLATIAYGEGRFDEAIPRLDEAAERYPQAPRVAEARYLAADACRQRGLQIQHGLRQIQVESTRIEQSRQATDYLVSALDRLEQLCQVLSRKSESELSRRDRLVLRNVYFAIGEVLFALGRYEEAAKAYHAVVRRYPDAADSLEAYVQMAAAYRRLNRPRDAQGVAEQARLLLNRLKPDTLLTENTIRDRQQWTDLLNTLSATHP